MKDVKKPLVVRKVMRETTGEEFVEVTELGLEIHHLKKETIKTITKDIPIINIYSKDLKLIIKSPNEIN